jgi:hypothetical protein
MANVYYSVNLACTPRVRAHEASARQASHVCFVQQRAIVHVRVKRVKRVRRALYHLLGLLFSCDSLQDMTGIRSF